jgi:hypothetical protein
MRARRPFFFFHIPKTAGSSMQTILSQHFAPGEIAAAGDWTSLLRLDRKGLSRAKLFQGHFYGSMESIIGRPCFRFTILRDPVERALSHYGHVLRDERHYLHRRALELGSIDAYIDDPTTRMTLSNFQSRMLALEFDVEKYYGNLTEAERQAWALERHIETAELGSTGDQLLTMAREKLESFDAVGITEHFPQTLALLCYRQRWEYPTEIQARNVNAQRIPRSELRSGTIQRLQELNDVDIALYSTARTMLESSCHEMLVDLVNRRAYKGLRRLLFG